MNNAISISDLCFSYKKKYQILNIPSLQIKEGEKVFIYGPSGSGKSTLLNIMAGVLAPTKGNISILGQNLSDLSQGTRDILRGNHIGFIFQNFNLISYLTTYENILLPLKSSKHRYLKIKDKVFAEISRIAKHLELDEFLDRPVTKLSIGQQQRVAVARALIGGPEVIIADEPTSSLDDEVTDSFMKLLLEEHKEKSFTLIFVSHDKRLAKYFDRQISLLEINHKG